MIRDILKRFVANRRGAAAVTFAISVLPLALGAGMALDYSRLNAARTNLQAALDASVLAGAPSAQSNGAGVATQFLLGSMSGATPTSSFTTNADGSFTGSASLSTPVLFGALLGQSFSTVSAKATAVPITTPGNNGPVTCLLALDPVAQGAFNDVGITKVNVGCRVVVNSSNGSAVTLTGNASLTSQENCIVGGVSMVGNATLTPPRTACNVMQDPFTSVTRPSVGACDHTNYSLSSFTGTLKPGNYCGGLKISSGTVTFAPGVYIISNGGLSLTSGTYAGQGVAFYFTGSNTSISITGNAKMNFTAPTSGKLASFIYYFDPATSSSGSSSVTGSSQSWYEGILYMPGQAVSIVGTSDTSGASPFTAMIADTFHFTGNATVTLAADPTATKVPVPSALVTPGTPVTSGWRLL